MKRQNSKRNNKKIIITVLLMLILLVLNTHVMQEGSQMWFNTVIVVLVGISTIIILKMPKEKKDKKIIKVTKWVAKRGLAILTGDLEKDYALLKYVNPEDAEGWLDIEGQTYSPVMRGGRYRKENFLKKPSEYGEIIKKETPYDVIFLEGNSQGKVGDKRHAGFIQLEDLRHYLGKTRVKYIDKEGIKLYNVIGVRECSINELKEERLDTTEAFVARVRELTGTSRVLKRGGEGILILQTKTDISITIAILEEDGLDDK